MPWSRDHSSAILEVSSANLAAVELYKQLGFTVEGRRDAYYGAHDALLMRRHVGGLSPGEGISD